MPRYTCTKGCKNEDGTPKAHNAKWECPYEDTYRDKKPKVPSTKPPDAPGPTSTAIAFKDSKAEVVKTDASKVAGATAAVVDFIIDGPHTILIWDLGLQGFWYVTVAIDVFVFDSKKHMPRNQFGLSDMAKRVIIPEQPRNFYARIGTQFCKWAGAKNVNQAHGMIDTLGFFSGFGGLIIAIGWHYRTLSKDPEYLKRKAEKRSKEATVRAMRGGKPVIDTTGVEVPATA